MVERPGLSLSVEVAGLNGRWSVRYLFNCKWVATVNGWQYIGGGGGVGVEGAAVAAEGACKEALGWKVQCRTPKYCYLSSAPSASCMPAHAPPGTDILLGGNPGYMARLKLQELLFPEVVSQGGGGSDG